MAENPGIAPPDATSNVGKLRYIIPDSTYVPLATPIPGQGSYDWFSDAALETFLALSDEDLQAAALMAWRQIGDFYASQAVSVTTDDLRVDLTKRAQFFYDRADAAAALLADDIFVLAPLGRSCGCRCHAELAEPNWPWGIAGCCSCN